MAEISRRSALGAAVVVLAGAGGAALGVTRRVHHKIAVPPPPPPKALTDLLAGEQRLLAGYDTALAGNPAGVISSLRADIASHIDALHALLEFYPGWRLAQRGPSATGSSSASTSGTASGATAGSASGSTAATPTASTAGPPLGGTTADLAEATRALAAGASTACIGWRAADQRGNEAVPLLGSIAACLATHLEALT